MNENCKMCLCVTCHNQRTNDHPCCTANVDFRLKEGIIVACDAYVPHMEFKVGDSVRIIEDDYYNMTGTIFGIHRGVHTDSYYVTVPKGQGWHINLFGPNPPRGYDGWVCNESALELIKEIPNEE